MISSRLFVQKNIPILFRSIYRCTSLNQVEPLTVPVPNNARKTYPEKIQKLVRDISQLTLTEVADLSALLKTTLKLPDAPMMPMGDFMQTSASTEEEPETNEVQATFTVKLVSYQQSKKVGVIKEIKEIMGDMNLLQAKTFIEGAPVIVKANISKEEANKLKETLSEAGGDVTIE